MDNNDNPFECGFDKYVCLDNGINYLGKKALQDIKKRGVEKINGSKKIDLNEVNLTKEENLLDENNNIIGFLRSAYSPKFKQVVGIAMIMSKYCQDSQKFKVNINKKLALGKVCNLPIL